MATAQPAGNDRLTIDVLSAMCPFGLHSVGYVDERARAGWCRQLFDHGLNVLATDGKRGRELIDAAAKNLIPLTLSENRVARRNGHLGMVMVAVVRGDAPAANTHLNRLLLDGWDPSLPAIRTAVAGLGRTLALSGWQQTAGLAESIALRVELTITALGPPGVLAEAARLPAPAHVARPEVRPQPAPLRLPAQPVSGRDPRTPALPSRRGGSAIEREVAALGGQAPYRTESGDWVVRGRRIRWIDPLRVDADDDEEAPVFGNLSGALVRLVGRMQRVAEHAAGGRPQRR